MTVGRCDCQCDRALDLVTLLLKRGTLLCFAASRGYIRGAALSLLHESLSRNGVSRTIPFRRKQASGPKIGPAWPTNLAKTEYNSCLITPGP